MLFTIHGQYNLCKFFLKRSKYHFLKVTKMKPTGSVNYKKLKQNINQNITKYQITQILHRLSYQKKGLRSTTASPNQFVQMSLTATKICNFQDLLPSLVSYSTHMSYIYIQTLLDIFVDRVSYVHKLFIIKNVLCNINIDAMWKNRILQKYED